MVHAYFYVDRYYTDEIMRRLWELGCDADIEEKAYRNLTGGDLDTGLCYSNYRRRESVMVIAKASSPSEFFNSFHHELKHLESHISDVYRLDPTGEEVAYLSGEIAMEMFPKVRHLICDCCRESRRKGQ